MVELVRLRHAKTGVVIRVDAAAAAKLDKQWRKVRRAAAPAPVAPVVDPVPSPVSAASASSPVSAASPEEDEASVTSSVPVGQRPAQNASRGRWAAYAESVGIDPGDLKRAEIIALVEGGGSDDADA